MVDTEPTPPQLLPLPADAWQRRPRHPASTVTLLVLALSMGSCVGCLVIGSRASNDGAVYADASIRAITESWDFEAVRSRAAPEMLSATPADKLKTFITFVAGRLGPVKRVGPIQSGQWQVNVGTQGLVVTTSHFADCEFEKAPGRVSLRLVRRHGAWQVQGLFVNADALMTP